MFYYYKKEEIEKGKLFCVYQSNEKLSKQEVDKINEIQNNLLADTVIYNSNKPFTGYPIIEDGTIRQANDRELLDRGVIEFLADGEVLIGDTIVFIKPPTYDRYWIWDDEKKDWIIDENKLLDGQYIVDNKVVTIQCNKEYIRPKWNRSTNSWEEGITKLDIAHNNLNLIKNANENDLVKNNLYDTYVKYIHMLELFISTKDDLVFEDINGQLKQYFIDNYIEVI